MLFLSMSPHLKHHKLAVTSTHSGQFWLRSVNFDWSSLVRVAVLHLCGVCNLSRHLNPNKHMRDNLHTNLWSCVCMEQMQPAYCTTYDGSIWRDRKRICCGAYCASSTQHSSRHCNCTHMFLAHNNTQYTLRNKPHWCTIMVSKVSAAPCNVEILAISDVEIWMKALRLTQQPL